VTRKDLGMAKSERGRSSPLERPVCVLCGGARSRVVLRARDTWIEAAAKRRWSVVRCSACEALYTSPRYRIEERARAFGGGYPFYSQARRGRASRLPFLSRASRLGRVATKPGRLLDLGCGDGVFAQVMRASGWSVVGVDVEESVVRRAREALGLDCRVLDIDGDGAWPSGRFDAVTAWGVLQLSYDPRRLLARIRRKLSPDGLLAVGVSNAAGIGARLFAEHWYGYGLPRHLVHFTPGTLKRLLEESGFRLECAHFETPRTSVERSLESLLSGAAIEGRRARQVLCRPIQSAGVGLLADAMEFYARPG
jgi:2-polyprenyl-3-methyl-5-hydroxy-6-metoxy-1,4-benzoquinol methylase